VFVGDWCRSGDANRTDQAAFSPDRYATLLDGDSRRTSSRWRQRCRHRNVRHHGGRDITSPPTKQNRGPGLAFRTREGLSRSAVHSAEVDEIAIRVHNRNSDPKSGHGRGRLGGITDSGRRGDVESSWGALARAAASATATSRRWRARDLKGRWGRRLERHERERGEQQDQAEWSHEGEARGLGGFYRRTCGERNHLCVDATLARRLIVWPIGAIRAAFVSPWRQAARASPSPDDAVNAHGPPAHPLRQISSTVSIVTLLPRSRHKRRGDRTTSRRLIVARPLQRAGSYRESDRAGCTRRRKHRALLLEIHRSNKALVTDDFTGASLWRCYNRPS
jgi:hypothetical protein